MVSEAQKAGVSRILNVGYSLETSQLVCKQSETSPLLFAAVGVQPHDADSFSEDLAQQIRDLAFTYEKVVAVGEIGLDAFHNLSTMKNQITCYKRFLALATEINLPVIVHMRNTYPEVLAGIKEQVTNGIRGVIHCFTGSISEAKAFLDLGFYISFSGIVTFKNPSELDEVVRFIPKNRILCETDAPYLAPKPFRGKTNRPSYVTHVALHLAKLRNEDPLEFAQSTTENALSLFTGMRNG